MLKLSLIGMGLVAITIAIHAAGTTSWLIFISNRYPAEHAYWGTRGALKILLATGIVLVGLHAAEILVWAYAYFVILPAGELESAETAVYFSFVTFTTLGYGDITLSDGWRLLSGFEALNGILLVGWTTAMLFAVVQRSWQRMGENRKELQE